MVATAAPINIPSAETKFLAPDGTLSLPWLRYLQQLGTSAINPGAITAAAAQATAAATAAQVATTAANAALATALGLSDNITEAELLSHAAIGKVDLQALKILAAGASVTDSARSLNFTGGGATITRSGGDVTVNVPTASGGAGLTLIGTNVTSGSATSTTFTLSGLTIPSTAINLVLQSYTATNSGNGSSSDLIRMQFNGDTSSNYSWTYIITYPSNAPDHGGSASDTSGISGISTSASAFSGGTPFAFSKTELPNFKDTSFNQFAITECKTFQANVSTFYLGAMSQWLNNAALTSITLSCGGDPFIDGSTFYLYAQ